MFAICQGPIPRFAIERQVQHRLQIARIEIEINGGDGSSSDSNSNNDEHSHASQASLSDESDEDESIGDSGGTESIGDNEGDENGNDGMMQMEDRDLYEEVHLPENLLNLNNEDDRAEYVLRELRKWAKYGVSTKKIDEILTIFNPLYPNLPKSYKTLLGTPRQNEIYRAAGGEMWYKGIKRNIEQRASPEYLIERNEIIIDLSMDGLPPYKYSYVDCWPILGKLKGQEEPFVVAVYIGETKPNNVDEFLEDLVNELRDLQENGIDLNGVVYPFKIHNYICDAPARCMIKCIANHNSTYGCERCEIRGVKHLGVMTFDSNAEQRTDESFANRNQPRHHQGISPLENIGTGMVTQFVLDGLHLLHEGVFKRWLEFVLGTTKTKVRRPGVVGGAVRRLMSETVMELAPFIPIDFNRRSRPFHKRAKFRATELRRLFLYDGLLVFQHLPANVYRNYLLLQAASYILSSPDFYLELNDIADLLVQEFVAHARRMFGEHFVSYYIHTFLHFPGECARLGHVESFAAYPYENYLAVIKRLLRSKTTALEQIANRDSERGGKLCKPKNDDNIVELLMRHDAIDEGIEGDQYYGIKSGKLNLSVTDRDCCFKTKDQDIAVLTNVVFTPDREIVLVGRRFQLKEDLTNYPIPSSTLGIVTVSYLRESKSQWLLRDVSKKCVLLPIDQENFLCIPLLHSRAQ